jgi:hypothetical protein
VLVVLVVMCSECQPNNPIKRCHLPVRNESTGTGVMFRRRRRPNQRDADRAANTAAVAASQVQDDVPEATVARAQYLPGHS